MSALRALLRSPLAAFVGLAVASALAGCPAGAPSATGISLTPLAQLGTGPDGDARLRVRVPLGDGPDRHVQTLSASWTEAVVYFDSATARVAASTFAIPRASFTSVPGGVIENFAGTGTVLGDAGPATSAKLLNSHGIACDAAGNVFIAETGRNRIRRVDGLTGIITTVAGTGTAGHSGDGGLATAARLNAPESVAVDAVGNLYIVDNGSTYLRKVAAGTGIITTICGQGGLGHSGDGGPAVAADMIDISGVCVDGNGNIFFTEYSGNMVRRIDGITGIITTIAGTGVGGYSGDGGAATSAQLQDPDGIAVDRSGRNLYIAEEGNNIVRRVDLVTKKISTFAGTGAFGASGDGGPATSAELGGCHGLDVDGAGNVYIVDINGDVMWRVDAGTNVIHLIAGTIGSSGNTGDGGQATAATLNGPSDVAVDASGNLYLSDEGNRRVRKISGGYMEFVASGASTPAMPVLRPATDYVANVDLRTAGTPADIEAFGFSFGHTLQAGSNSLTLSVMNNLNVSLFAGDPSLGDGTGAAAFLNRPGAVAIDPTGTYVYVADERNNALRRIAIATGVTTTVAGNGQQGGTNGTGLNARFDSPLGVAVDPTNTYVYVADTGNSYIRRVTIATGFAGSFLGGGSSTGSYLDGNGTNSKFKNPNAIVCDSAGNLYVADTGNHCIRKVTPAGATSLVAGQTAPDGTGGFDGVAGNDDGVGALASFNSPQALTLDEPNGVLYVADTNNRTIRKIVLATKTVSTFVPTGGGLRSPTGIAFDGTDLWVADTSTSSGDRIRKVTVPGAAVSTVAGSVTTNGFVDANGTTARFNYLGGIATLPGGTSDLFIADTQNHAIRRMVRSGAFPVSTLAGSQAAGWVDGPLGAARFRGVDGMCLNAAGTKLYLADVPNERVRMIDLTTGLVSTIAGSGIYGYAEGACATAQFKEPIDVALNAAETVLYVSDSNNYRIRAIDLAAGTISRLAGSGYGHTDGTGGFAEFQGLEGLWSDPVADVLYAVERYGNTIRKVTPAGVVTTFAGSGIPGEVNGPAASARFDDLYDVAGDGMGNLFVSEYSNALVRKLNIPTMTVSTYAGRDGATTWLDGLGTSARFISPARMACDAGGNVFVADKGNNRIRKIARDGYVTTIAGTSIGYANGFRDLARLASPWGVAVDGKGVVYVGELDNHVIRRIQ